MSVRSFMQFLSVQKPRERFWNRRAIQFACAGALAYLLPLLLDPGDPLLVLSIVSISRLGLTLLVPGGKKAWLALLAMPYPFALVFAIYSARRIWLPEAMALELSGPTAFLMFTGGALLLSLVYTSVVVDKAAVRPVEDRLRNLSIVLFGITSLAVILSAPEIAVMVMRYAAEPVALIGYAAILGWGTTEPESDRGSRSTEAPVR